MSVVPSAFQVAIYDFLEHETGSAIIQAVAGSGKTYTSVTGMSKIPGEKSIISLAFNRDIAEESKTKVPVGVDCATFHSVGMKSWLRYVGRKIRVEKDKTWKIIREEWPEELNNLYGAFCNKMVGYAKNAGLGTYMLEDTPDEWEKLMYHFDVQLSSEEASVERALELCSKLLRFSQKQNKFIIDFDDMLYAPLCERATFNRYDVVFIDEAQDTNDVQIELLSRMIAPQGRLIAVGDEYQAIYGFRGANSDAMEKIRDRFNCKTLPLSVSYRCSQNVVKEAQGYMPTIQCSETAEEGKVDSLEKYQTSDFQPSDAILCRNVAPLVEMAYGLIGRKIGVNFLGREIGKGLIALVKKMKAKSIDELEIKLNAYKEREVAKLQEKNQDSAADACADKVDCIFVFIGHLDENNRTIDALIAGISELCAEKNGRAITLATVHKSKGLEWHHVYILDRDRMPSKYARQAWQMRQENNLIYVAITRAKTHLTYITSNAWKEEGK